LFDSKPYRYARKGRMILLLHDLKKVFQNLIGMLGSAFLEKIASMAEAVSKPYRYARKYK